MRHSYLNKKEIYSALRSANITTQESRELLKKVENCTQTVRSIINITPIQEISAIF